MGLLHLLRRLQLVRLWGLVPAMSMTMRATTMRFMVRRRGLRVPKTIALEALMARGGKRTAAGNGAKPPAMKKPASATTSAGSTDVDAAVVILPWTRDGGKKEKRVFQSRAYHASVKNATMVGLNEGDAKLAGQIGYKIAGDWWVKKA